MARKRNPASRFARDAADIAVAAPQVIAIRMARIALAGATPSAKDRREFERMHTEKLDAFNEGWLAMWTHALRTQQQASLAMLGAWWMPKSTPTPAQCSRDALAIMGKGMAPVRRRAVANAKRLAKAPKRP